MGRQIQVAQSLEDEEDLNRWLLDKYDLMCLPRRCDTDDVRPVPLGDCNSVKQVLFGRDFQEIVEKHVCLVGDAKHLQPNEGYHVRPTTGLCIEWNRSCRDLAAASYGNGRYYLGTVDPIHGESYVFLKRVLTAIIRRVKSRYPGRTHERYPTHIGPDLVARIRRGDAELLYGNGEPMDFEVIQT